MPEPPCQPTARLWVRRALAFLRKIQALLPIHLEKQLLKLLDRLDAPYRRWQRDFEPRRPAPAPARAQAAPRVAFVFPPGLSQAERTATLGSLHAQSAPAWEAWFQTPADLAASGLDAPRARLLAAPAPPAVDGPAGLYLAARQSQTAWIIPLSPAARCAPWLVERLAALDETAAAIVYWDEDVWDGAGPRRLPFFKPDWSPELWLSVDILRQAACSRPALLRAQQAHPGLPLPAALLALEQPVLHLAEVLSHLPVPAWEDLANLASHRAAAQAWLAHRGLADPRLEAAPASAVLRPAWTPRPELVSIVIPTRDHAVDLRRCLDSLASQTAGMPYEIILVDNLSTQPEVLAYYTELRAAQPQVRIASYPQPFNINAAWNLGARQAGGSLLLFLNNDTAALHPHWLLELARAVQIPGVAIAGARLEYPDGSIQHQGIVLGLTGHANHLWIGESQPSPVPFGPPDALRNVSAVTGACLLIRRAVFEELGGFNEDYQLVFSDVEICLRARARGYRTVLNPNARLLHFEGRSRARHIPLADLQRAARDFLPHLRAGDPCYSPNLSLARTHPAPRRKFEMSAPDRLRAILGSPEKQPENPADPSKQP